MADRADGFNGQGARKERIDGLHERIPRDRIGLFEKDWIGLFEKDRIRLFEKDVALERVFVYTLL